MKISQYLAYGCFIVGCLWVCLPAMDGIQFALIELQGYLTIAGVVALLARPMYRASRLVPPSTQTQKLISATPPFFSYLCSLFFVQMVLMWISWVFFSTVEYCTQLNPRLLPLMPGQLSMLLQDHPLLIGILPWVLYSVSGVALAYFSVNRHQSPILAYAIVPEPTEHPKLFFHNYIFIVVEAVKLGALSFLIILSIIWLCEGSSSLMGWPSLFKTPMKTVIIISLIMIAFRKSHQNFLMRLRRKRISLGGMLAFYVLCLSFIILCGHGVGDMLTLGEGEIDPSKISKSVLLSSLSKETQNNRLIFLVWGWWGIWLPWIVSVIARLSLGRSVRGALLSAMIFPLIFFLSWHQWGASIDFIGWASVLQKTAVQLMIALSMLGLMMLFLGRMHSSRDILRGGMLSVGKLSGVRPLRQWVNICIVCVVFTLPGLFILGWFPFQLLLSLGAIFITTVMAGLTWILWSSKGRASAVMKCRVQGVL